MANIVYGSTQNSTKKQLNDLYFHISFDIHKELSDLSVERITGLGSGTTSTGSQLRFTTRIGDKPWEQKRNVNSLGHSGLDAAGEAVMLVVKRPTGNFDIEVDVPFATVGNVSGTTTVRVEAHAGRNQATFLASGTVGSTDIITNIISVGNVALPGGGFTVRGAKRGDNFRFISVPTTWGEQSFVRAITPNEPKNFTEVADHFDGAADTIRVTVINALTFSKVFEDIPGSFKQLTDRNVTLRADVRENDSTVPSEVYYFTGVRSTGRVTFNRDGESITEAESTFVDWITVTG